MSNLFVTADTLTDKDIRIIYNLPWQHVIENLMGGSKEHPLFLGGILEAARSRTKNGYLPRDGPKLQGEGRKYHILSL